MPRSSKTAQTDEGQFVPYTSSDALVPPAWQHQVDIPNGERQRSIDTLRGMHYRVHNSPIDPLTVAHLIDVLERWSPAYYIRSRYIVNRLNASQDAISYETIQVGRMMGELTEVINEEYAEYPELAPLVMKMDYRGNAWFINSQPSTYKWFWKVRKQLVELAATDIQRSRYEDRPKRASVYAEIDTTMETE